MSDIEIDDDIAKGNLSISYLAVIQDMGKEVKKAIKLKAPDFIVWSGLNLIAILKRRRKEIENS